MTQAELFVEFSTDVQEEVQYYRRELPDTCISFLSKEGKKIFMEAMASGHMECYFKLASQFRTQEEPTFCGLSSLVMLLNALEVDPGRIWKSPWRWYHESMLDSCISMKDAIKEGINFNQFVQLAESHGLQTLSKMVDDKDSEESFRKVIQMCTQQEQCLMCLSYSREVLSQTGDGHFSPVGGYHPERDLILILDTARFKYPPHWIPLSLMFQAMQAKDMTTGKPRGYVVLTKAAPTLQRKND